MAFNHKHLIDITEYSADDIMTILETAKTFKQVNERRIKKVPTLKGFTVVNMFNEPSTRTRSSFEIAEKRLSCDSLNFGGSSTSAVRRISRMRGSVCAGSGMLWGSSGSCRTAGR